MDKLLASQLAALSTMDVLDFGPTIKTKNRIKPQKPYNKSNENKRRAERLKSK